MRWTTFALGAIGLAVLEAVVSRQQNAANVGGFIAGLGTFVDKFVSPAYPGLSAPAARATSSSSSAAGPVLVSAAQPAPPALQPAPATYPVIGTGPVVAA